MNLTQRIFGMDTLCSYSGELPQEDPEYECVPLVVLHDRTGSLIPGYTLKKYWNLTDTTLPSYRIGSLLGIDDPVEQISQDTIIPVLIPFPQKRFANPRTVLNLRKSTLMRQDPGINYLNKNNTREIAKFDFSELNNILGYVKTNGVLTLVLSDMINVNVLLHDFNRGIVDKFGYCVMYYGGNGKLNTPTNSSLLFHMTFMDLNTCIPIFDSNKTDGVGILCEYINRSGNEKVHNITGKGVAVILSNNTENVITVDGTVIGEHGAPYRDFMNTMIKASATKQQPKAEAKEALSVLNDNNKFTSYGYVSNSIGNYSSSTTTTWNNY